MQEDHGQQNTLLLLLRSAIFGEPFSRNRASLDEGQMEELLELAQKHRLLHLVAYELDRDPTGFSLSPEIKARLNQSKISAILSYNSQYKALDRIAEQFERARIPFIPLKGAVLRDYYPQPWMRSSSDIDVLVHPESMEQAETLLLNDGYEFFARTDHDRSYCKGLAHVELHFSTIEEGGSETVLRNIWDWAEAKEGWQYQYVLRPEMFVFYHVAHMAKHFLGGGCGIRSYLDLKIIENQIPYDRDQLAALLEEAHLNVFMDASLQLSDHWFGNRPATDTITLLEEYILKGGVYGILSSHVAVKIASGRKKGRYVFSRLFLPLKVMTIQFPALKKAPILLPVFWIVRWFVLLFTPKRYRKSRAEMRELAKLSESEREKTRRLLTAVGLD